MFEAPYGMGDILLNRNRRGEVFSTPVRGRQAFSHLFTPLSLLPAERTADAASLIARARGGWPGPKSTWKHKSHRLQSYDLASGGGLPASLPSSLAPTRTGSLVESSDSLREGRQPSGVSTTDTHN